jgi:2-oxoglutarate dehydrogenase E1 component
MKKQELSKEQKTEIEKFGANTWFVESVFNTYKENPDEIPEQWKNFFSNSSEDTKTNATLIKSIKYPDPSEGDEPKLISGSSARILDNMSYSLSIPTASSQRTIPVKLLEENRIFINNFLAKNIKLKISFTHIIAFAVIQALKKYPVMNNYYSEIQGKPTLIKRKNINLGIAIDIEKKDGSRSLIVPNVKNAENKSFKELVLDFEDIVNRSRKGTIDPGEFQGTTITITNPGTIGTVASMPRLMVGQGTNIAIGAIEYPAQFQAMSNETIAALGLSKTINITSTYDHRIIQGAESGLFLKEINDLLIGNHNFYLQIFSDLKISQKPLQWQVDSQNSLFEKSSSTEFEKQARVLQLINMFRVRGHLNADIDPLGTNLVYHKELDPAYHGLTIWDLDRTFITGGFGGLRTATLRNILGILQRTYCQKIGVEYMHIQNPEEKAWLQDNMEPFENKVSFDENTKKEILARLIEAEGFEHFIHTNFLGHKRFSLEGSETLIPVINYLLNISAKHGVEEVVLGMAHRGRLNVLANLMGKGYDTILSEFEDLYDPNSSQGSGDVKYHLGASGQFKSISGVSILVSLASNPSHLEFVDPVVEGIVRAKQTRNNDTVRKKVIPLLIHGDSAFAGQGIVAETLNLSQLNGYKTGGTIHIIINNQIGFTTTPDEARSTQYATDVAKMVQAPIFHVNGDDPEAAIWVTQLGFEYHQKFNKDVVIDLIGYRRHGHNEGDEPGFTQPILYDKIKQQKSVTEIYSEKLYNEKVISSEEVNSQIKSYEHKLYLALERVKKKKYNFKSDLPLAVTKTKIASFHSSELTAIDENILLELIIKTTQVPKNFNVHPKLKKFLEKRLEFTQIDSFTDWAFAETLAFASLLKQGIPIRLSGQDSVRGTFSQRHLSLTDFNTGEEYFPINHMYNKQAKIEAIDSLLSEAAVLGFEYGYSVADPLTLVLWEAQFGDFANGAQVLIDNFIVASNEKWQTPNNLVLLLPHGFEGQGPEHSSARLERFLVLSAQENIEVVYPSTPAQYFHLLRRQMFKRKQRPLIVMTPKSLLRHPEARSSRSEFIKGKFYEFIDDFIISNKKEVNKVILTSGKIYYELNAKRIKEKINNTAIIRVEQFYPFSAEMISSILSIYNKAEKLVWVQEEPKNMGAWNFLLPRLDEVKSKSQNLVFVGRDASASPAPGSYKLTMSQQQAIILNAFNV